MSTPLFDAIRALVERGGWRYYMPGHKGRGSHPLYDRLLRYDITEIPGADALVDPHGPIARAEQNLTAFYGTTRSLLSAGGSTLCIQAMLALARRRGVTRIVMGRDAHVSAIHAAGLLGLDVTFAWPQAGARTVTPEDIARALEASPDAGAVYVTGVNYLGDLADVAGIARVAHERSLPLLVDNAHGAHLHLTDPPRHPAQRGADLCCDSLHKTLPAMTGAAALHVLDESFAGDARDAMNLFMTTSPSYPILLSADVAIGALMADRSYVERGCAYVAGLKRALGAPFLDGDVDPMRLTLEHARWGHDARSAAAFYDTKGIVPDYVGDRHTVFLLSGNNTAEDAGKLRSVLGLMPKGEPRPDEAEPIVPPQVDVPIADAIRSRFVALPVDDALGRTAAQTCFCCPPGTAITVPGERVDAKTVKSLKNAGIYTLKVIQ